jgi:N6-adenosine-specific RNA methylase IME4
MMSTQADLVSLPRSHYAAILCDPPWKFEHWGKSYVCGRDPENHYSLMTLDGIRALPVGDVAAGDCVLFLWVTWPMLAHSLSVIEAWGFVYKTCAFAWMKADVSTINMFEGPVDADMKLGYWTRANSEVCLLATRGKPKRLHADVRQGIIESARQHSRKPDCVQARIERLVAGPYLELFARQRRPGWTAWGNETDKFAPTEAAE